MARSESLTNTYNHEKVYNHEVKKPNNHGHENPNNHEVGFSYTHRGEFIFSHVGEFNLNKMDAKSYYKKLIQSQRWVKLRAEKVANNPLCERCLLDDITTPTQEVHHIRPVESSPDRHTMMLLCFDYNNLQSLCSKCHKKAHIELQSYTKEETQKRNKAKTDNFVAKFLKRHNPP